MIIVYTTNTGSTQRYAELLGEKTGFSVMPLSEAGSEQADEVIYFGWVMAGAIQGLDEARAKFGSLKAVCAVGMMPGEKQEADLKAKNSITEPLFVLQGAFDMKKLKGMYKMMMSMMLKMMKSKLKGSDDPDAQKALALLEDGFDMVNAENLEPLLAWLNGEGEAAE